MKEKILLHAPVEDPLHMQGGNGAVVNVRGIADKKYEFFVVGSVESLPDTVTDGIDGTDFLETRAEWGLVRILRMVGGGEHGFTRNGGQEHVGVFNPSNTASGEDVFAIEHGIVKQILNPVCGVGNQVTLDHGKPFCVICEGAGVARQVAEGLSAWLEKHKNNR